MSASFTAGPTPRHAGRRGVILVGVLWILVFLAFLAVVLRLHMSGVVQSVRATEDKAAAHLLADSGLALAAAMIRAGLPQGVGELPDELDDVVETAVGRVSVRATNEALRIDLNTAPEPLLEGTFIAAGASRQAARQLTDTLIKARKDGLSDATGGAISGKGHIFRSVSELAAMKGMTEPVALVAQRYMTVASGLAGVRVSALDERLISAIPDFPRSLRAAIQAYRSGRLSRQALQPYLAAVPYNNDEKAITWRARLAVELGSGYGETYEALVIVSPQDDAPYRVAEWRRVTDLVEEE